MHKSIFFIFFFLFFYLQQSIYAQKNTVSKPTQYIEILNADKLSFDKKIKDAQRLIGNVRVKHEDMYIFCDSALYFSVENKLYAYGKLHIKQGDTLNIYADSAFYNGNTQIAKLRGKIRLIENDLKLETDSIDFDKHQNIAYYTNGAKIYSLKNKNTLTSIQGKYYSSSKHIQFKDKVLLKHPEYEMTSDTLIYGITNEMAVFIGPTLIRTTDNTVIYCEDGWYDTKSDVSSFNKNTYINKQEITLKADTILYNRKQGVGDAYGNIFFTDTINKIILNGQRGYYNETSNLFWITRQAMFTKILEKDSLYISADTLKAILDTVPNKNNVYAWHQVKLFKNDLQGICDSLTYCEADSLLKMFGLPVLWSDVHQLTAEYIQAHTFDGKIKSIDFINNSFIISEADSVGYNQVKGKNMKVNFMDDKINSVFIKGNGQTIYFVYDEKNEIKNYIGMNKTECSDIRVVFDKDELKDVIFINHPESVFYPLKDINPKDKLLKDFKWHKDKRPKNKQDLLIK
jgi:lipopolysaccharide export system protein LptA